VGNSENAYGPDKICQRTACTAEGPADHLGGAHLDPRDRERFNGNETSLRAVTYKVRDELNALHYATRGKPELEEIADVAIHAALKEISFLSDQNVHIKVDADHKVLDASKRALDCEHHGKTIQQLEEQVHHFDRAADRADKGRLALLGGIHAFDEFISGVDRGARVTDLAQLIEAIRGVLKKTHAAHDRAWSAPSRKG
jgi:hypothetical protein